MHRPSLYSQASDIQQRDAEEIVKEYSATLSQHSDGKRSLLDVGSGSGNVLMDILVPALGRGFSRVTGVDISPAIVEYMRECYGEVEGFDFKELNIETEHLPPEFHAQYDRVTSIYCLQWIRNQRKALENIFKCLRLNGDCLLVFPGSNSVHDIYEALSHHPRWGGIMKSQDQLFSPFFKNPQIGEVYEAMLKDVGFTEHKVEVKLKCFSYEGLAGFKDNMKAINPFPLSDVEFDEFFIDFCHHVETAGLREPLPGRDDFRFLLKYRLVVIYARKRR